MAAVLRGTRDCKHQQGGQTLKASWQSGITAGRTVAKYLWRYKGSSVLLRKESKRCFHKGWIWHSCRVPETPRAVDKGGWNFQRGVSKVWESHSPAAPQPGLQAQTHMHTRAGGRRQDPMGIKTEIWQVPHVWVQMAPPKWRPGLHPWHCLPCSACSSKPSERGIRDALLQRHLDGKEVITHSQHKSYFFLPMYTFQGTTGTNVVFYPLVTSSRSGIRACCIRRMGQWSVAAWKTLGISVLPTEASQHPTWWVTGRMASPKNDAFGNVASSGTTAIWECRYSWSVSLSTHLRLHAVAGKIESTVSEIVQKAHSYVKKDPAAPPAAAAPCCYLNYKHD